MADRFETAFRPPPSDKDRAVVKARHIVNHEVMYDPDTVNVARQLLRALCLSEVG